jgi:hypothetical protein
MENPMTDSAHSADVRTSYVSHGSPVRRENSRQCDFIA